MRRTVVLCGALLLGEGCIEHAVQGVDPATAGASMLTITSPSDGDFVSTRGIAIEGAARGGAVVQLFVDGAPVATRVAASGQWRFDGVVVPPGRHDVSATTSLRGVVYADGARVGVTGDNVPPSKVVDLDAQAVGRARLAVSFTPATDDSGRPVTYDVRWSTTPIVDANFDAARRIDVRLGATGPQQTVIVDGVYPGKDTYVSLRAVDAAGNPGELSNLTVGQTGFQRRPLLGEDGLSGHAHRGQSLAAGDFNGDGIADVAVGVPGDSFASPTAEEGAVEIYFGRKSGLSARPDRVFVGSPGSLLGAAMTAVDLDGDGVSDLAIGAPGTSSDDGDGASRPVGAVYVLHGGEAGMVRGPRGDVAASAWRVLHGSAEDDRVSTARLGSALAAAHFDGDEIEDLVVGAPGVDFGAGGAFIVAGGRAAWQSVTLPGDLEAGGFRGWFIRAAGFSSSGQFGAAIASLGRAGRGKHDAVGLVSRTLGEIVVFRAPDAVDQILLGADAAVARLADMEDGGDHRFSDVRSAGDVNGDGIIDLAISEPSFGDGAGRVLIVDGDVIGRGGEARDVSGNLIASAIGELDDHFGADVAAAGYDLNGDGNADAAIACAGGVIALRYGPSPFGEGVATARVAGASPDAAGARVMMVGDVDDDGLPDLVFADPSGSGQVQLLY